MAFWNNIKFKKYDNLTVERKDTITCVNVYYDIVYCDVPGKNQKEKCIHLYNYSSKDDETCDHKRQSVHLNYESAKMLVDILKEVFELKE